MATLIPSLGAARFDARGELRLAERLKDCLEDNAWVWHNIPVGPFGKHPDFVTLHPQQGIVVLEVKDWRLDTIGSANSKQVELITDRGNVSTANPFEQVRSYMFNVVNTLQRDPLLVVDAGSFKGKPVFSFGHGVVFSNITRKQFEQTDLHEVFPPERCIFRDEMAEKVDADAFRERVWNMVSPRIGPALSLPQTNRVRAILFPEIRVTQIALPFDGPPENASPAKDRVLEVMDMQQEQVARSMGEGHRIVRGVAGSGKTLILAFRAEQIARAATGRDAVRLLSMHTAKGLEFPCVAIGGLGELKKAKEIEDDIRLTYVAITRATHEAFITYSNMSELVGRLVV